MIDFSLIAFLLYATKTVKTFSQSISQFTLLSWPLGRFSKRLLHLSTKVKRKQALKCTKSTHKVKTSSKHDYVSKNSTERKNIFKSVQRKRKFQINEYHSDHAVKELFGDSEYIDIIQYSRFCTFEICILSRTQKKKKKKKLHSS